MIVAIINYGMGNIKSVENALKNIGAEVLVTSDAAALSNADAVILPGVGGFSNAMENLKLFQLVDAVRESATKKPFLGICLGMQLLFDFSLEDGRTEGLKIFSGSVERIPAGEKVPHMGWNSLKVLKKSPLLKGIGNGQYFYFVHSYRVICSDNSIISSVTCHGTEIISSIESENVYASQFHPEKSSGPGLQILKNFCNLAMERKS